MNILEKAKNDKAAIYLEGEIGLQKPDNDIFEKIGERVKNDQKVLLLLATKLIVGKPGSEELPFGDNGADGAIAVLNDGFVFVGKDAFNITNPYKYLQDDSKNIQNIKAIESFANDFVIIEGNKNYFLTYLNKGNIDDITYQLKKMQEWKPEKKHHHHRHGFNPFPFFPDSEDQNDEEE
ncbi:MAG: hypothetical protein HRT99_00390 [Mycoplasmatales bacterium]|nr:hypothetical protein [Mycoplasmatales bacterium]